MIKVRLKYAFLTFFAIAGATLASSIIYLESESFAGFIKKMISERSPQKLGIVGDFSNLKFYFFPPGIGVASPKIKVSKNNISQIPMDGKVEAKELRVSFAPLQMFSGILQVSEVQVNGGSIEGTLYAHDFRSKPKVKTESTHLRWQDLVQLQINGVRLHDTYLNLKTELGSAEETLSTELVVKDLSIKKDVIENRDGVSSTAIVNAVRISAPPSWKNIPVREANQLEWNVQLTDQGIKLDPFRAELSGVQFKLTGAVNGNILDEKSNPQMEAQADIHLDLGTFFLANFNDDSWGGEVNAKAKISSLMKDPVQTLKGQFSVQGREFAWKNTRVSKLEGEGAIDLHEKKLKLQSLELHDYQVPTGHTPGSLKISTGEIPLQFNQPFQAQIEMANADLQWLGGIVASEIAALDGAFSGKINAQFLPDPTGGKAWRIKANNDFKVDGFALTNQRFHEPRPKHYVLKPAVPVKIVGPLEVSGKGVDFKDLKVSLEKSQFMVNGGVHGGTGYDFSAKGPIELKEVKEIAENEIFGDGELDLRVHGPSTNVLLDFDVKLKDAIYLGMHFGNLNGRVTYDDGIYELRFTNIHANHGNTFYSVNEGFIDLSGSDDLRLPFDVHVGRIEDFADILQNLVKKVSWYPDTLKGEVHGKINLGGKLSTPKLQISSQLEGSDWNWLGERARRVKLQVGFDQGTYFARNVEISKSSGQILGNIEYVSDTDAMKWDLRTENLSLLDFDFFDRLEIPAKSKIEISSKGEGTLEHLKSKTEARVFGTEIKGERFDDSSFKMEVGESTVRASVNVFGDKLSSQLKYSLIQKQPSSFRMDLNEFDFSPTLLVLNPKLLDDPELNSSISGHFQLDFLTGQSELARGEIQVKQYLLEKQGFRLKLIDPINVPIQLGYFHFPPSRLQFKNAELTMGGEGKKGDIDFSLKGQTDLALSEFFTSSIQQMSGKADTEIRIHGPLKDLKVNGDINFTNARALMRWMQSPFEQLDGSIHIRQGLISVESLDSYLGDEVFSMSGKIQTFTDRFPDIDLRARFEDNKVKMVPLDLVQVRGPATIKGSQPPYVISGNLEIPQALWTRSFSQSGGTATSRGDRFLPQDKEKQLVSNLLVLDLNVNAPQGFNVRNEIVDAEFKGKVKLVGPPESPKLLGEGQLVQGRVLFKDRPFIFESAKIEFDDPYQLNPKFNASAISEVNQYKVRVLAYGKANGWKAEFSSAPFLPESEIFSLLASGYASSDASRFKARDRSYVSQGEAASLILHSMDFSKDVQSRTGFQFDVEEAVDSSSANSIFRPQSLSDNIASPKLVIKRQVGRNISVSFGSTVGVGSENQKEVNAEYKLTPSLSALGVWNNIEEVNTKDTRTSFGLDLKFKRRFR